MVDADIDSFFAGQYDARQGGNLRGNRVGLQSTLTPALSRREREYR